MNTAITTSTKSSPSPIELASRNHNLLFGIYVFVLIVSAALTVLVWRSGNKLQESLLADANARIADSFVKIEQDNGDAKERIATVESDSRERIKKVETDADIKISSAHTEAVKASAEAARANRSAQELAVANTSLQLKLEEEKTNRLRVEAALAPRMILMGDGYPDISELEKFKGFKYEVLSSEDGESRRAAAYVIAVLNRAGWENTVRQTSLGDDAGEGVSLGFCAHIAEGKLVPVGSGLDAADALKKFLNKHDWDAVTFPLPDNLPDKVPAAMLAPSADTIRIKVGLKPVYHFFPEDARESIRRILNPKK